MSIADAPARAGALIAIQKVGRALTYVRVGPSVKNTQTGVATPNETEYPLRGVITRVSYRLIDGSTVMITDRMVLIDAISFEAELGDDAVPSTDDRIKVGASDLAIVLVDTVISGEQNALHKIVVRR